MKYDAEDTFLAAVSELEPTLAAAPGQSPPAMPRRIALIGCFRPRQCGIATYTADVHDHLRQAYPGLSVDVFAMRADDDRAPPTDPAVVAPIDAEDPASYRAAADAINRRGAEAVWLQHEFGIFGGPAGAMIVELAERIAAPLVITLHTVLAKPSEDQRRVMERLIACASSLMVMSEHGRQTLIDVYGAAPDAVALIEHGTPVRPFVARSPLRTALDIGDRPILSTFGLLGHGKGLETAIRALPAIVRQHPDVLYRIVGATHPNLIAAEGEAYRDSLKALADELGVGANIAWENRFLAADELLDQIALCDIYLAPYPNLAQVTSGTLAYAVALGRAVVSTPFVHARELLAHDVGVLVPRNDGAAIAKAVLRLLAAPDERRALQMRAHERGRRTAWPRIVRQSAALIGAAIGEASPPDPMPPRRAPAMQGLWALCDDVGILQHSQGIVPDRDHGYCIDDNARALMLLNSMRTGEEDQLHDRYALRFASFIQHAWNPDAGAFRNFMGYDRRWLEDRGSEDSNGRAIWTLGHCAAHARSSALAAWAREWFDRTAASIIDSKSPRAVAFAMLGADALLSRHPGDARAGEILGRGAAFLDALRGSARGPDWDWFEPVLAYDNARLPEALWRAGRTLGVAAWRDAGLATLAWLCQRQTAPAGHFRPVGSNGFGRPHDTLPFDQQPLEAWATVAACGTAFAATRDERWRDHAEKAWRWFHGANDRGVALASMHTGRCHDGLTPRGVNRNSGAESTLAFHLAYHAMDHLVWTRDARTGDIRGERAGKDIRLADADMQT